MSNTVVLLHGLGRSSRSMRPLEQEATRRGYQAINLDYSSRSGGIAAITERVAEDLQAKRIGAATHFVTHSLGGILLRAAAAAGLIGADVIARVVMLAPPNQGSEIPDRFSKPVLLHEVYRLVTGPAGDELGVTDSGLPRRLPPVPFETGVIAGSRTLNPIMSAMIPGANDGKVSVDSTMVAGMRDHLVVPHSHTFIMRADEVIAQTFHFLEHGTFKR